MTVQSFNTASRFGKFNTANRLGKIVSGRRHARAAWCILQRAAGASAKHSTER